MKKIFFSILMTVVTSTVWACPACHTAVSDANKPPYTLIILGCFVLAIYIPFYILLSAAKRYDPKTLDANE